MSVNTLAALATGSLLSSGDNGFHAPTIDELFPDPILFAGTPFEINRVIMVRLIAVIVLSTLLVLYSKRAKLVPGRAQSAMELLLDFSKKSIGEELIGAKAAPYQPMIATIFLGVLFMNITGIIPGLQIAGTSVVGMPLIYALAAYVTFIIAGFCAQGVGHFFKSQLFPPGVPWPIYILMTPIELLSTFVLRPITLAIRLLANLVAGHFLLVLCFLGTNALYLSMGGPLGITLGTFTLLGGIIFTVFEAFVACLQAYIFALLTAAYISLSIEEH
ncbi:F0F1 ATP synthase subunit A [Arcanobacterium haemolyticum]|nr:F0F1 ATP synthase subunit A [Arcanobacterium haemolyticum]